MEDKIMNFELMKEMFTQTNVNEKIDDINDAICNLADNVTNIISKACNVKPYEPIELPKEKQFKCSINEEMETISALIFDENGTLFVGTPIGVSFPLNEMSAYEMFPLLWQINNVVVLGNPFMGELD